ncbi:MAG: glycosyltransferase, partial [Acidimicrobiia bacterium]
MTRTPPRVLVVASTDRRRGAEVFSERLRDGLAGRGWPVDAVALVSGGDGPTVSLEHLTDSAPAAVGRLSPAILTALRRRIMESRPDVVVANGGATLRYAALAVVGSGARLAYVAIGEPNYWLRSSLAQRLNRALLGRPDLVLSVSEATRRQLAELRPGVADRT